MVRLPRDWLGPREELVPFGPRADATAAEAAGSAAAPPSANDFWGEQSAELQHALQGPEPVGAQDESALLEDGQLAPDGEPGGADSAEPGRETHLYGGFLDHASFARRWIVRLGWPWTLRGGGPRAAPAALTAAVATVAGILVITSGSGAPAPEPARAPAKTQGSSLSAALAADAARQRTQRRSQPAPRLAGGHRSPAHTHHQRILHRAHTASPGQVAAGARPIRSAASSSAASYGSQTGGGTAPVQSSASAAPPAASSAPATSSAASDQGSSSGGTHPYGLGGTVGPGHSPNG